MSEDLQKNNNAEVGEKKSRKVGIYAGAVVGAVALTGLGTLFYKQDYDQKQTMHYAEVFFPQTTINGIVCDEQSSESVEQELLKSYDDYVLNIKDYKGDIVGQISASDIGAYTILHQDVADVLGEQNEEDWKKELDNNHEFSIECSMGYDKDALTEYYSRCDFLDYKNMIHPTNARIGDYNFDSNVFELVPDNTGTKLDVEKAKMIIRKAIEAEETEVDISDCYYGANIKADDEALNAKLEELNSLLKANIRYDWNGSEVLVDSDLYYSWIVDADGYCFDEDAVKNFVTDCSEQYDTYRKPRKFTTIQGVELELKCGDFGWQTDIDSETEELLLLLNDRADTDREPIYKKTGWIKGQDDIGNSYIEIDLTNQHLYVIIDGEIDFESDVVSGCVKKHNTTPAGVYGVTYKTRNVTLKGPTWNSFVKYWMPFNGSIGMHDASWRKEFGGDIYLKDGSHGCVNLPTKSAATVYEYVSKGYPVICYYYEEE